MSEEKSEVRHSAWLRLRHGREHCLDLARIYSNAAEEYGAKKQAWYLATALRASFRAEMWARVGRMSWGRALLLWVFGR